MLTKNDLKKFVTKDYLDKKFKENNENLIKQIFELFDTTNQIIEEKLDKNNEKLIKQIVELIDIANERIDDQKKDIDNHEDRIEKIEEKVFSIGCTTTSS